MAYAQEQQPKVLPKPVDWDELYPGRFLKAADFKGKQVTLRISDVKIEELIGDKGAQIKGVIRFKNTDKEWALNKTNGICLREMFGRQVQDWVGKRVTLFPSTVRDPKTGKDVPCIRVHGSPDIANDIPVTIQLPRKRPTEMTMHRTGPAAPAQATQPPAERSAQQQPAAAPSPVDDEFDAEASRALDRKLAEQEGQQ